ncbi:unnamed protein product [Rhizoctonia solani]|uniref:Uncharacterized protein n=1 Tax=Rhizoctonia solani TaxID=456999 RepID=A0A8H3GFA1_9AGAM|nr:unnamed protein product [Rhizoctonia solani]
MNGSLKWGGGAIYVEHGLGGADLDQGEGGNPPCAWARGDGGRAHVRCELGRRTLADKCIRERIVPFRGRDVTREYGTGPALGIDAVPRPNTLDSACIRRHKTQNLTLTTSTTSSATTTVKRRAESPAARPSPKRSRSEETADDSFLALLLPESMSRFQDHYDERVTLPPIAEDRRASLPVPSASGYVFTNTFESPRSPQYAPHRRPNLHNRTFSSPALPAHNVHLRNNTIGLQDDALAFSPVPPGAIDWLGAGRQVTREESMSEFDPSAFGLDSGASSPAFAFGPGPSPFSGFSPQFHPRSQAPINIAQALASSNPSPMNSPAPNIPIDSGLNSLPSPPASRDQLENELGSVRAKIRELEFMNDLLQLRVVELESEKNKDEPVVDKSVSPAFQQSWDARTESRVKRFCSLNRAGNALCAWHDSRRERRSFPPRMAPPGHLNCGCTYEEALFEESLARHGVGSYHPGESVRMDPALRNPLLKLLQWRFGYKDGDFEREPKTGGWVEGEGEHAWENRSHPTSGSSARRRERNSAPNTTE